jgi:hypothetical protein
MNDEMNLSSKQVRDLTAIYLNSGEGMKVVPADEYDKRVLNGLATKGLIAWSDEDETWLRMTGRGINLVKRLLNVPSPDPAPENDLLAETLKPKEEATLTPPSPRPEGEGITQGPVMRSGSVMPPVVDGEDRPLAESLEGEQVRGILVELKKPGPEEDGECGEECDHQHVLMLLREMYPAIDDAAHILFRAREIERKLGIGR